MCPESMTTICIYNYNGLYCSYIVITLVGYTLIAFQPLHHIVCFLNQVYACILEVAFCPKPVCASVYPPSGHL